MEATGSSKTSVDFQRTPRSYIPEGGILREENMFLSLQKYVQGQIKIKINLPFYCVYYVYRYFVCSLIILKLT
jgi:hypothetical protein